MSKDPNDIFFPTSISGLACQVNPLTGERKAETVQATDDPGAEDNTPASNPKEDIV